MPFFNGGSRGQGRGSSRGGRGVSSGRGGRGGRGGRFATSNGGKLARSGIKTRNGYKKFDSQRLKDVSPSDDDEGPVLTAVDLKDDESGSGDDENSDQASEEDAPRVHSYSALLQSFQPDPIEKGRGNKRRKINHDDVVVDSESLPPGTPPAQSPLSIDDALSDEEDIIPDALVEEDSDEENELENDGAVEVNDRAEFLSDVGSSGDERSNHTDPYEVHFGAVDQLDLAKRVAIVSQNQWKIHKRSARKEMTTQSITPDLQLSTTSEVSPVGSVRHMHLKQKIFAAAQRLLPTFDTTQQEIAPYIANYRDLVVSGRTPDNAPRLRALASLHILNHVLKGRDRVIKNTARLARAKDPDDLEFRDQGFTRPKVLILLETRQMASRYADSLADFFGPEQQENKQRFQDSFTGEVGDRANMPPDFSELFEGNDDNNFLVALKITRKTLKFYSSFYTSDIIMASPLGLRRVIENEDAKKQDYDFLSSIEIVLVDQADAMQMQNWENVELVFKHLNLQMKEAHDCDFNRVRNWYLDGHAKFLRQTIVFGAYLTPEINRLFNTHMQNVAGKAKVSSNYAGCISQVGGLGMKQSFTRFACPSPANDPDARFKYFTTAVLPALLRLPRPADGQQGILVFVPSYFDFLRVRNFFATSTLTENISFGAIHDYSEVSEQRRARSHFASGRHAVLLYTQRAHHFYRLRLKGVKRVAMYSLPDNPVFYEEIAGGFVRTSIEEGKVSMAEASVRNMFSKWDGLRLERIVGSERVKSMLGGLGDTFDFV